ASPSGQMRAEIRPHGRALPDNRTARVKLGRTVSKLTISVTNDVGVRLGRYEIEGLDSPSERQDQGQTGYILNQTRIVAEVQKYYADFAEPTRLYLETTPFALDFDDPTKGLRSGNVNALWLEIENLFRGARRNFAESRIIKDIETEYQSDTPEEKSTR